MCPTACTADLYLPLTLLCLPLSLPLSLPLLLNSSSGSFHLLVLSYTIRKSVSWTWRLLSRECVGGIHHSPTFLNHSISQTSTGALKRSREYWNSSVNSIAVLYYSLYYIVHGHFLICVSAMCLCACVYYYWFVQVKITSAWIRPAFFWAIGALLAHILDTTFHWRLLVKGKSRKVAEFMSMLHVMSLLETECTVLT